MKNFILISLLILNSFLANPTSSLAFQESKTADEEWKAQLKIWSELPKAPKVAAAGLVWVYGWPAERHSRTLTQGAGVHILPGWVLVDQSVIDGLPLITVSFPQSDDPEQIDYLVTACYRSSSPEFVWLEVPGIQNYPKASIHKTPFAAGDYIFGFLEANNEKAKVYKANGGDGTKIERATKIPFAYSISWTSGGPDVIGAYPLFDNNGLWSGFLTKEEPPRGLSRRIMETPSEVKWINAINLADNAPSHPPHSMSGFPFQSFSELLSGWNTALEHRDRIGAYCARNPDDPWGWLALGMAQIYAGRSPDGLAALYRAEKQLPESSLAAWITGDALADSLAFEQALPFYERAIKLDPSIIRWSDKSKRIQNIYSILGNPKKESNIQFGNPASPEVLTPRSAMDYGEWLMSQDRYLEAEAFLQSAWQRSQKGPSDSWISDMVLRKLLETMYRNGHIKEITALFGGDFGKVSETKQRFDLAEFWNRHGLAESQMAVYQQWLSSPIKGNDWLYNLPASALGKLLSDHRDLIRSKFEKPTDMIQFFSYKMNSCENVLIEVQREKEIIDDPIIVSIQVKCLHKLKRTHEAAKLISTVSAQKDNPYFKHWAGDLWLEIGEAKRARDAYMADIADGSNYWRRWQGLGEAFQELGEEEKASDAFSKALQESKKGLEGIFGHHGGSGEAYPVELMQKLIELDKKDEVLEYCRYSVQLGFGIGSLDKEESTPEKLIDFLSSVDAGDIAVSVLRNTLAANPTDANAWLLLGNLYLKLGDSTDAAICLQRLKNLRSEASGDLEKEITKRDSQTGAPTP